MSLYAPGERLGLNRRPLKVWLRNPTIRPEAKHRWPDGVEKWIGVRAQVLFDKDGQPTRVIGVAMDVTERRLAEDLLRLTARELQHRVKNNLAVRASLAGVSLRARSAINLSPPSTIDLNPYSRHRPLDQRQLARTSRYAISLTE